VLATGRINGVSDSEVSHHSFAGFQQDVLGLEIAVNDPVLVRTRQRGEDMLRDADGFTQGQLPLTGESLPERLALDIGHRIPELARSFTGIEQGNNVRMLQASDNPDFLNKTFSTQDVGQVAPKNLEGYQSIMLQVVREIDRGHATPAELPFEHVPISDGSGKIIENVGHGQNLAGY
jgi:hypothetical protein